MAGLAPAISFCGGLRGADGLDRALERGQFERLAQNVEAAVRRLRRVGETAGEQHGDVGKPLAADLRQPKSVERAGHDDVGEHEIEFDALLKMAQRLGP